MKLAEVAADTPSLAASMAEIGQATRAAAAVLARTPTSAKNMALLGMAAEIRAAQTAILAANDADMGRAKAAKLAPSFLDRLQLTEARIEAMARGLEEIAALPDPVGETIAEWTRPNGLAISRVRTPIGVIGVIYESRPNVTADAGALCLKAGNAAVLRGGSDSFESSRAIADCLAAGLAKAGLPRAAIQLVPSSDRAAVGMMLAGLDGNIDLIIPRGGKSLVARVQAEARVPVFSHLEGICHVYVDKAADPKMARDVVLNAKMRRTGICGAAETLLVDRAGADRHLKPLIETLIQSGCEVRGCRETRAADPRVRPATEADWSTEYLDAIVSMRVVDGVDAAIDHIARYGSQHTDAIITDDEATAEHFLGAVDSAIVLHNASTQFADGGEFGMGAEIGIATGKLHARGPVGVEQLTTFKYVVRGSGQTRP
ncbi:glutamate-5-semialdehyde dehydrogenase [Rhodoligotrophos defluvii]|uniref:glutamate-5-semialdehyde dehydrogenase n=1 Tax=Rhodoligotrophos defluvii TaxID=2561934 RepID=UPI0010C9B1B5|nr:glutamate-5-semialdehyde dehydrogenase [Rhodoligotrophos defluvii]